MTISILHPFDYMMDPSEVHDGRVHLKYSGISGLKGLGTLVKFSATVFTLNIWTYTSSKI